MMPQDITKVKSNIQKMIDQQAPESDIDQYIASEGVTLEDLKAPIAPPMTRGGPLDEIKSFVGGIDDMTALGFSDEIKAGGGAIGDYLANIVTGKDRNFSKLYDENLARERDIVRYDQARNPNFRTAGQVGGALVGPAAKSFMGGVRQAALEGGLYGAGSAEGDLADRAQSGVIGAGIGAAGGGLFRGLAEGGKAIGAYARKSDLISKAPTIETIKKAAGRLYKGAEKQGVNFKGFNSFVNKTIGEIKDAGSFKGGTDITEGVLQSMREMTGDTIDFVKIDQLRRRAGTAASSKIPDEARLGSMLIEKIDDFVESSDLGTSLIAKSARKLWQKNKKSQYIEQAIRNAEINPSGMKQGLTVELRKLYKNPKIMRGWTKQEKDVLKNIILGDADINTLSNLGKFSIGIGKNVPHALSGPLGVGGAGAIGGALGGPPGAIVAAGAMQGVGMAGREVSDALQLRNAQFLSSLIRSGMDKGQVSGISKVLENIGSNDQAFQSLARMINTQAIEKSSKLFGKGQ